MSRNLVSGDGRQSYGAMEAPPEVSFSNFSPTEFYNLCENITTNIYSVSSGCKNLERALKALGTAKDNVGFRENIHVSQLKTNQTITLTTKDITRLKMIVRKGDKQQKLQVDKLTSDFKEAVETNDALQKQVVVKMKANMLVVTAPPNEEQTEDDSEENSQLMKQQQLRERAFEQEMLLEQEARIKRIEMDILDVNEIMKELSTLVLEQGEVIDSIESNIENTAGNIEEGTSELQKASQYQNKARKKLLILIIIAAIVAAILIGVLVTYMR